MMEQSFRQTHLHPFRFDTVIQQREEIGYRLIRPVRRCGKSKSFLRQRLLPGLVDKITHILFEKPDDMTGENNRRFHGTLSSFSYEGARPPVVHRLRLTGQQTLLYDGDADARRAPESL